MITITNTATATGTVTIGIMVLLDALLVEFVVNIIPLLEGTLEVIEGEVVILIMGIVVVNRNELMSPIANKEIIKGRNSIYNSSVL